VVADWQRRGLVATVVTQNVDGFHARAGGRRECWSCTARWRPCAAIAAAASARRGFLEATGSRAAAKRRPGVAASARRCRKRRCARRGWPRNARRHSSLGSSLAVSPANLLPKAAVEAGAPLIIINRDPTPLDAIATLVINASIGDTLRAVDRLLP
jgi:NAD-dependent deacetylase